MSLFIVEIYKHPSEWVLDYLYEKKKNIAALRDSYNIMKKNLFVSNLL